MNNKLNLSYSESAAIQTLGYDFSKVSYEFRNPFTKTTMYRVGKVDFFCNGKLYEGTQNLIGFTPIIPVAAVEACLPEFEKYDLNYAWAGHTAIPSYLDGEGWSGILEHTSAFDAFMWCSEHYPDSLRYKFDTVVNGC